MGNIKHCYSDYIRFYLSAESKPAIKCSNIVGWNEFGLDSARNRTYHGTLNQVSKTLGFTKEDRKYILDEYKLNGVLAKVSLIVSRLKDNGDVVTWIQDEPVYADFYKMNPDVDLLEIPFNSNSLMNLIDSYEDEEFEIERLETYDNKVIDSMSDKFIELKGRSIISLGESRAKDSFIGLSTWTGTNTINGWSPETVLISQGPVRHVSVDTKPITNEITASNLFYVNSSSTVADNIISVDFSCVAAFRNQFQVTQGEVIQLVLVQYNDVTANFDEIAYYDILNENGLPVFFDRSINKSFKVNVSSNQGLMIKFKYTIQAKFYVYNIKISEEAFFETAPGLRFNFVSDIISRLMYILTNDKNILVSNYLGRKETGYSEDGEGGLIGVISGLQARAFDKLSEKYKSPKISLKDVLSSISNCFNLGYGVETINNKEVLVVEKLSYFYRQEVVGRLPFQISNVKRRIDEKSYYSGLEIGYEKGGDYANEMGLDEPNIKSQFITPINNSTGKFKKFSKIRADEYGLETLRRKPQITFPNESLGGDEDNWFLDLKRKAELTNEFEQVEWQDRLSEEPVGIHSPETFRSMLFTPMRMLHRLASNFKSGLYLYGDKFINFVSSSSNRTLQMKFINEDESIKESDNIKIGKMDRPIFKNEIVSFTHPYNEELRNLLFGKTKVNINGEDRMVPNFYFKYEWLNEENEIERGYFLKYEYEDNPTLEFQIANEEIIIGQESNTPEIIPTVEGEFNSDYSNDYNN